MRLKNNFSTFLFALFLGIFVIALLTSITFLHFSERHVNNYRRRHMISIAKKLENKLANKSDIKSIDESLLKEFSSGNKENLNNEDMPYPFSFLKKDDTNTNIMTEIPEYNIWLVNRYGQIQSSLNSKIYELNWDINNLPSSPHELRTFNSWVRPSYFILKLRTKTDSYLLLEEERPYLDLNYISIILGHSFANTSMAMLLALVIVFFYLKKKSNTAANVMAQLESGNLKARFEIGRFDEFTNLLCNFNRMADKIEGLVVKLRNAESTRTQFIQELGHDLKTPLTSMLTNSETLLSYYRKISEQERHELLSQLKSDIIYFKHLIENLTEMASLDDPSYKYKMIKFDLKSYLMDELKTRQAKSELQWSLDYITSKDFVYADSHLIDRVFRNAFDNSSRFAKTRVLIKVIHHNQYLKIIIMDDGPGLTPQEIQLFAKRRERRKRREGSDDFSLGFGSIIMKSIVELHGGTINISNLHIDDKIIGSNLEINLLIHEEGHMQWGIPNLPVQGDSIHIIHK